MAKGKDSAAKKEVAKKVAEPKDATKEKKSAPKKEKVSKKELENVGKKIAQNAGSIEFPESNGFEITPDIKQEEAKAPIFIEDKSELKVIEEKPEPMVSEEKIEPVAEVKTEAPAVEPGVTNPAVLQESYVDSIKEKIAAANKAKADWLAKMREEKLVDEGMKKIEEQEKKEAEPVAEVENTSEVGNDLPLGEEVKEEIKTEESPLSDFEAKQEAILESYIKVRGSYTDINHFELANTGFDIHSTGSNLEHKVGRFTMRRMYVGAYWNVTENK